MIHQLQDKAYEVSPARPAAVPAVPKLEWSAIQGWRHEAERLIGQHPGTILAISLGAGFLFGWWNKRT